MQNECSTIPALSELTLRARVNRIKVLYTDPGVSIVGAVLKVCANTLGGKGRITAPSCARGHGRVCVGSLRKKQTFALRLGSLKVK